MNKFLNKDDFTLEKKSTNSLYTWYKFVISGESANYLKKRYGLRYNNVKITIFDNDFYCTCGSIREDGLRSDVSDLYDFDVEELKEMKLI